MNLATSRLSVSSESYEWHFCSCMNACWVVWKIRGGGDTQTLLPLIKNFELALRGGGDVKMKGLSPYTHTQWVTRWNFHYLIFSIAVINIFGSVWRWVLSLTFRIQTDTVDFTTGCILLGTAILLPAVSRSLYLSSQLVLKLSHTWSNCKPHCSLYEHIFELKSQKISQYLIVSSVSIG